MPAAPQSAPTLRDSGRSRDPAPPAAPHGALYLLPSGGLGRQRLAHPAPCAPLALARFAAAVARAALPARKTWSAAASGYQKARANQWHRTSHHGGFEDRASSTTVSAGTSCTWRSMMPLEWLWPA